MYAFAGFVDLNGVSLAYCVGFHIAHQHLNVEARYSYVILEGYGMLLLRIDLLGSL